MRIFARTSAALGLLAALSGTHVASAWDKTEHDAIVASAYRLACIGKGADLPFCNHDDPSYATFAKAAGRAAKETDLCHSFWFSDLGIELDGANAKQREYCAIIDGVGYTDPDDYYFFGANTYFVRTNSNHFGAHAVAHAKHYLGLATLPPSGMPPRPPHRKTRAR